MSPRILVFLLLGLLLALIGEWDNAKRAIAPLRQLDQKWVDFCLGNATTSIGAPSVTMVRITDEYEPVPIGRTDGNSDELTRLDYAAILYAIGKLGPKSVAFMPTPVFSSGSVLNDNAAINPLKDAVLQLPRLTVASQGSTEGGKNTPKYQIISATGDTSTLPQIASDSIPADADFLYNGDPAFIGIDGLDTLQSGDPRVPLVARVGDQVVSGFIVQALARQAGLGADAISLDLEADQPLLSIGELYQVPVASDGTMAIPSHAGLSHSMYELSTSEDGEQSKNYQFASLKVEDVALAAERSDSLAKTLLEEFGDKYRSISENLVLVGFDRSADRTIATLNDEFLTPMTATARAIATIQSGRHTGPWPMWARIACYGAILVVGCAIIAMRRLRIPAVILVTIAVLAALVLIFRSTLLWIPPFAIFALLGLLAFLAITKRSKATTQVAE